MARFGRRRATLRSQGKLRSREADARRTKRVSLAVWKRRSDAVETTFIGGCYVLEE